MKFFASVAAAVALAATASAAFSSCGSSSDSFSLSSVSYTPNPPKVGQDVCITLSGTLSAAVTDGAILAVTGTFLGIKVYSASGDLCEGLAGSSTPCPIAAGAQTVTQCVSVPSNVPAGISINLKAVATAASGSEIFCISGPLTFSS
ncbi:Phosphatidylglycerol/phosphatidylinositol transfer protein [Entomortierella chlamydospora]|uniref:Phosphatidylglycerol/phosphatidylinositol transfer protein n=1 Tax=Entomortierella chlamydospora TaxID=101097 RepID=A0A9P6MXF2_9FUNG|nr:Phosphatidylglycerol/phosphatidylinositol transfer protein [Entomortierella chlamydospora]KAG0017335.1 Phosphatidylglycerol/phosphatidylinositol transfer protein [Entomortierella chlamydospora]